MEHSLRAYDSNYFGSKLNYFVSNYCKKTMVVNNIDMIINDYENKIISLIESKHDKEPVRKGQKLTLTKLRQILPKKQDGWTIRVLVIRGNYPYDTATLESIDGTYKKQVNKNELINFLNGKSI
jgi:hypothetical protein